MNAAAVAGAATTVTDASHVFADAVADRHAVAIAAVIDPAFLTEAGWDAAARVLCPPSRHPLLGRPVCRAAGCSTTATDRSRICASCRRRLSEHRLSHDEIAALPARPGSASTTLAETGPCCAVAACTRPARHRDGVYCEAHQQRLRALRGRERDLDEQRWRVTEPAIGRGGQVSLRGLPLLLVAQVLFALQQRCRINAVKTKEATLRALCDDLRRQQVGSLGEYVIAAGRDLEFNGLASGLIAHAGRALSTPETEVGKDEWDLVVFGHSGTVSFIGISQRWLRETAKRWAADDLPKRRVRPGRRTSAGLSVRHHIGCLVRLTCV